MLKTNRTAQHHFRFVGFVLLTVAVNLIGSFPLPASPREGSIVDQYGQLRIEGNRTVDQNGSPVALRGMSFFWSQWIGKYYNSDCAQWLADDWRCTVLRAAMAVEGGGYLTNPQAEKDKVKIVIDVCIDLGIYVIVDWHDHNAQKHQAEAIAFFQEIASEYGEYPNVIYEIFNEPLQVSWPNVVKPYADTVVAAIREIDPDNIIIIGSPTWSQDVDVAAANPVVGTNLAYALHYYAATHKQSLRNKATFALGKGKALWVTEFGTCESSGSGVLDYAESQKWFDFMDTNLISWCNWAVDDKVETSAALKPNASATGGWQDSDLTESGAYIRGKIIACNGILSDVQEPAVVSGALDFRLARNFPNPFNSSTVIEYDLATPQRVRIEVFNEAGETVASLPEERMSPGTHRVAFQGNRLPSGEYIYRILTEKDVLTGRMQLVK